MPNFWQIEYSFVHLHLKKHYMMRKLLLTSLFILTVWTAVGQTSYCLSYDDFVQDRWVTVDTLSVVRRTNSAKIWSGGNDYRITASDKALDKVVAKQAFVVRQGDSLYVNCRHLQRQGVLFGKGYAKALRYDGDKLCMINIRCGRDEASSQAGVAFMFGAVGAAVKANSMLKNRVCYLIDSTSDGKRMEATLMDEDFMGDVLLMDKELLEKYKSVEKEKNRESAAIILPILLKKGLIKAF